MRTTIQDVRRARFHWHVCLVRDTALGFPLTNVQDDEEAKGSDMKWRQRRYDFTLAALAGFLSPGAVMAQQPCASGVAVDGVVLDQNGSSIPAARVQTSEGQSTTADAAGHFVLPCVAPGTTEVTAQADGFAATTVPVKNKAGESAHLRLQLPVARVETSVEVGEDATAIDADHGAGTHTLNTKDIAGLADDPDDFQRQLQVLAESAGGTPGSATITVDGFQNSSALPPKGSIASIRVNPDMFSAEYEDPPYEGGRIEIFTKPGMDSFHGALFLTDSDGSFNATDPFSTTATPAGKRRYGFELSGPILRKKSDFALALEKRDIDEFNVVNAVTLDADGNASPLHQTVAAPQRLWIASARGDWQATPTDVVTLSFSANVNNLGNQGVGGLTLPDAGYSSHVAEYDLRLTSEQTISVNLLHETHVGFTWKDTAQAPLSTAPSLQVAGYFTGGGATSQNLNDRERDLEVDDDLLLTRGRHSLKLGVQSMGYLVHDYDPNTFNGAYVFGGGSAAVLDANGNPTGATTNIDGLEQYRRALLNLSGGTPTTYQLTAGTPLVPLSQWRLAAYGQDTVKLTPKLTLSAGLRYSFETSPDTFFNLGPRAALAWALGSKSKTVIHARAGIFNYPRSVSLQTQVDRLNGMRQSETLVYSPNYASPLTPVPGSLAVATVDTFPSSTFQEAPNMQTDLGAEHDLPHHWHVQGDWFYLAAYSNLRMRNINAPLAVTETGAAPDPVAALEAPRPFAPNLNIMQYQNSGHMSGNVFFVGLDQHSYKRFGFFAGYVRLNFIGNLGRGAVEPQSSYSDAGERARPDWERQNQAFGVGNLNLPAKVEVAVEFDANSGAPYNLTTGTDANGDGDFNDRPSYAAAPGTGVYATRFGLLSTDAVNGTVPRNLGTMPFTVHLDPNISRKFQLWGKKDAPRILTLNARSANLLNHTNVTAVGTIVSSPTFSQSLAAEAARRVELGARFTF